MSKKRSLPHVTPLYRCANMHVQNLNQMHANPHVRLGHGSKDTAHVRVDTSLTITMLHLHKPNLCVLDSNDWGSICCVFIRQSDFFVCQCAI